MFIIFSLSAHSLGITVMWISEVMLIAAHTLYYLKDFTNATGQ